MESQLWGSRLMLALNKRISEELVRRIYWQIQNLSCTIRGEIEIALAENLQTPNNVLEFLAYSTSDEVVYKISKRNDLLEIVAGIVKEREEAEYQRRR